MTLAAQGLPASAASGYEQLDPFKWGQAGQSRLLN